MWRLSQKNSIKVAQQISRAPTYDVTTNATAIVYLNGTTDYVEAVAYTESTTGLITGTTTYTYFEGSLLASGNGVASGTGASALATFSDVTLASPATGQILTYNGSSWVNSAPAATTSISGTTTMVTGWPDALRCNFTTPIAGSRIIPLAYAPWTNGLYTYRTHNGFSEYLGLVFNADGSFYANDYYIPTSGLQPSSSDCSNKSISQLYAEGKAFNFIGNSGTGGLGYALTSGTLNLTANSSGVISLTTAGTTWGYFGSNGSYLPTLNSAWVSNSSISGTTAHFSSRVGIGTSTPNAPLVVSGTTTARAIAQGSVGLGHISETGWDGNGIIFTNSYEPSTVTHRSIVQNGGKLHFGRHTSPTHATDMFIADTGRIGVGTTSPRASLDSPRGAAFDQISIGVCAFGSCFAENNVEYPYETIQLPPETNLRISFGIYQPFFFGNNGHALKPGGGSWDALSDKRLKDVDGTYTPGLREISALKPVRFHYKKNNALHQPSDREFVGLIAQDVQPHFPEAVRKEKDGYYRLDTTPISFAVINAIKELKAENEQHRKTNVQLQAENNRLQAANDNLAKELKTFRSEYEEFKTKITSVVVIE